MTNLSVEVEREREGVIAGRRRESGDRRTRVERNGCGWKRLREAEHIEGRVWLLMLLMLMLLMRRARRRRRRMLVELRVSVLKASRHGFRRRGGLAGCVYRRIHRRMSRRV